MSAVVGIDLSSKAIDLVKLDEESNRAEWVRCELEGKTAWERTLSIRDVPLRGTNYSGRGEFWEDVYLVAIEAPYGRGQPGTNAILNRVVGAVAASLPARLRVPERCWLVRPDEWKGGLGLKGKPTWTDIDRVVGEPPHASELGLLIRVSESSEDVRQNFRDAYCIALFARTENAKGVAA